MFLFQISQSAHYANTWQTTLPGTKCTECIETCTENNITCPNDSQAVADCSILTNTTGMFQVGFTIHLFYNQKMFALNITIHSY